MNPALITALASLASTLYTNLSNKQLSQEQRGWSEEMMDKENEYNLPINQMSRLKEAGLSPMALQMGKGFDVAGNTSASPNQYSLPQMLDPMSLASNNILSLLSAEKAKEEAKTEKDSREVRIAEIRQKVEKYKQEIVLLGLDQLSQQIANDYASALNEVAVAKGWSDIGLNEANVRQLDSLTDTNLYKLKNVLPEELQLLVDKHELNLLDQQEVIARIQNIYKDTELKDSQKELNQAQEITEYEKRGNLMADTDLKEKELDDLQNHINLFLQTYDDVCNQIANESKLTKRQVQAFWVNTILHGFTSSGVAAGGFGAAVKAVGAVVK